MKELTLSLGNVERIVLGPPLVILLSFFHLLFMIAHVIFETWLYLTDRERFKKNIKEGLRD